MCWGSVASAELAVGFRLNQSRPMVDAERVPSSHEGVAPTCHGATATAKAVNANERNNTMGRICPRTDPLLDSKQQVSLPQQY